MSEETASPLETESEAITLLQGVYDDGEIMVMFEGLRASVFLNEQEVERVTGVHIHFTPNNLPVIEIHKWVLPS